MFRSAPPHAQILVRHAVLVAELCVAGVVAHPALRKAELAIHFLLLLTQLLPALLPGLCSLRASRLQRTAIALQNL
jgi:hypothetical protein